jgi:hypothetical protein
MFRPVRSKRRRIYHSNIVAVEVSLRSQILATTVETTATHSGCRKDPEEKVRRDMAHRCQFA